MPPKSRPRPRTKPPEQRRAELMNAAQSLFLDRGIGPTTIEQITGAAAVAKGTFYLHFTSKEDLLAALGQRFSQELLAKIQAAVDACGEKDWQGKLAAWAGTGVCAYLDAMQLHDMVFHEAHPPTRGGAVNNILVEHLVGLLQAGVAAQAWSIEDPRSTAIFLFSGLHGLADNAHLNQKRINRTHLTYTLQELCFRALGLARGT